MVVKLSDFLTTSLVLTSLDSADVLSIVRSNTIGIDSNTTGDYVAGITGGTGINVSGTGHAAAATISVDNTVVTTDSSQTLTNKTFNLTNNTLQATLNQLNAAVSGATLVSLDGAETLTNKTLTSPTINGGSFTSGSLLDISTFGLRDITTTAYETRIRSNNASPALTADRILTFDVNNADRTISLTGNLTLGGALTTSGAHNTTFTTTGNTSLTLPTTGTLISNTSFVTSFDSAIALSTTTNLTEGSNLYYTEARVNSVIAKRTTDSIGEGSSNLYYTTARANADFDTRLATKSTTNLAEGVNLYYTTVRFDSDFGDNTTSDLTEGTNLYYTTARADSDFDARLATKTTTNVAEGTNLYYTTVRADSDFDVRLTTKSTTNLSEGTNLYYTTARADSDFDVRLATKTTTNVSEGTNLYYTSARADSDAKHAISVTDAGGDGSLAYSSDTGVITYTGPSASEVRAHFSAGTGISITDGEVANTGVISVNGNTGAITAKQLKAALETVDSNGSGLNADTLDGLQSSSYLRSDSDGTLTGDLAVTGNITLGGNQVLTSASDSSAFPSNVVIFDGNGDINFAATYDKLKWGSLYLEGKTVGPDALNFYVDNNLTTIIDGYGYLVENGKSYAFKNAGGTFFTNLEAVDPTADRTITLPNVTGTVLTTGNAADLISTLKTVDSNGSGLNADTLDGQQGSYYRIDVYDASGSLLN